MTEEKQFIPAYAASLAKVYPWGADGPFVGKKCQVHTKIPCNLFGRWVITPLGKNPVTDGLQVCARHIAPMVAETCAESDSSVVIQEVPVFPRQHARMRSVLNGDQ